MELIWSNSSNHLWLFSDSLLQTWGLIIVARLRTDTWVSFLFSEIWVHTVIFLRRLKDMWKKPKIYLEFITKKGQLNANVATIEDFFLLKSPFFTKQFFINNTLWFLRQLFLLFNYFLHHLCIHLKQIFWLGSFDEKSLVIMMKTIQFLEVLVQVFKMNRIDRSWE